MHGHSTEFDRFPPPLKVKAWNRAQRFCKERNRCRAYRRVWAFNRILSFHPALEGQGVGLTLTPIDGRVGLSVRSRLVRPFN